MSRKYYTIRVYFKQQPTNYYSVSAASAKAAVSQAQRAARGLSLVRGPRNRLTVAKIENLDVAGWSEGFSTKRFGDSTGVYHLMVTEWNGKHLVARAACSPQPYDLRHGGKGTKPQVQVPNLCQNCGQDCRVPGVKEKTRQLLTASKARRKRYPRQITLTYLTETKEGKQLQRQLTKSRRAIAERLRGIRQSDGHHLARVWTRAGGD